MLEVKCFEISEVLKGRFNEENKGWSQLTNVYKCNGIKINMNCCTEILGNEQDYIKKQVCNMELKDTEDNSELISFALDESIIRVNFLDVTQVNHFHLGDVLYEIARTVNKEVLITQRGEPKLYINLSFI